VTDIIISNLEKYLRRFGYFFFSSVLSILFSFIVLKFLTNYYSTDLLKYLFLSQNIFLILYSISFSNIYYLIIKKNSNKIALYKKSFAEYFYLHLISSIIIFFILVITLFFLNIDSQFKLIIFIINIGLIIEPLTLFYYDLFLKKKFKFLFLAKVISVLIGTLFKLYIIINKFSLIYISICFVLENIIYMIIIYYIFNLYKKKINFSFKPSNYLKLFFKNKYMPVLGISALLTLRLDIFVVNFFLNDLSVSIYYIASRPVLVIYAVVLIISKFLYPYFSKFNYSNKKKYVKFYQFLISSIFLFYLACFVIVYLFRDSFLILFGNDYLLGRNLIMYLLVLSFFCSIINEWFNRMILIKKIIKIIKFHIFSVFIGYILNYYFISFWGIEGVALSVTFAVVISFVLVNLDQPKEIILFFSFLSLKRNKTVIDAIKLILIKKKPETFATIKS
jgi:O-antigen/teichoic acid export membrane protein